ncbi:MAG: carbohydrate-binding domain-containing protein, partial [Gemmatimonadetes bacterium]|nr:carbohydrate-binding domain-containing protein [Gemmatimonadota bacterium]
LEADTDLLLTSGTLSQNAGGGSAKTIATTLSAKALKAGVALVADGGTVTVDAADDALHSNGFMVINDGAWTLSTGDDGLHAEADLVVNGGDIDILKCYEGLETGKADLTINGGRIRLVARDDGLNLAGDGGTMPPGPGGMGGAGAGKYTLRITGGYVASDAQGDGFDINGSVVMTGGTLLVHGPTANNNGAIDYDGTFQLTGGFLAAAGSSGMAMAPSTSSTQPSVLMIFSTARQAGTLIHVETASGQDVLSFVPRRAYQSVAFSSTALKTGTTYNVYVGGSAGGTPTDGLYPSGSYTPGTLLTSFTVSGMVTRVSR